MWRFYKTTLRQGTHVPHTRPTVVLRPYSERFTDALKSSHTPMRTLARAFAEKTGNDIESERPALYLYKKGESEPTPERAAILAVLLSDPSLALVQPQADRRTARRAELEARVAELERAAQELAPYLAEVAARVAALEQRARPRRQGSGNGAS